jgi:hypothetical protein
LEEIVHSLTNPINAEIAVVTYTIQAAWFVKRDVVAAPPRKAGINLTGFVYISNLICKTSFLTCNSSNLMTPSCLYVSFFCTNCVLYMQ